MRTLYYRVTAVEMWRSAGGLTWVAHFLIRGQSKTARGTVPDMAAFPAALQSATEAVYLKVTGEPLPAPDGQLKLL